MLIGAGRAECQHHLLSRPYHPPAERCGGFLSDEKSQIQNKAKALRVLKARLKEIEERERDAERAADRRSKIGSGDRSEKIRTYNFPQGRVTDHRISLTVHRLGEILEGDLDLLLEPLIADFQAERLKAELS